MIEEAIWEVSYSETIFQRNNHLLINYLTKDFFQVIKNSKPNKADLNLLLFSTILSLLSKSLETQTFYLLMVLCI